MLTGTQQDFSHGFITKVLSKIQLYVSLFYWVDHQLKINDIHFLSKVVNDRWGSGIPCKHGGFYTCQDRYNPGHLVTHKWEDCFTVCHISLQNDVCLIFRFVK